MKYDLTLTQYNTLFKTIGLNLYDIYMSNKKIDKVFPSKHINLLKPGKDKNSLYITILVDKGILIKRNNMKYSLSSLGINIIKDFFNKKIKFYNLKLEYNSYLLDKINFHCEFYHYNFTGKYILKNFNKFLNNDKTKIGSEYIFSLFKTKLKKYNDK